MDLVAVVAAGTSLLGAVITVVLGALFERRRQYAQRERARQDLADRYSQPLMAAASALAARLGNAVDVAQVREFTGGNPGQAARYADYMLYETLYRLARYLCWAHIVSRELRVLDLGQRERNRQLVLRLAAVQHAMNRRGDDLTFLLLGGEQWALGELMVERDGPDGEPRCMTYVTFRERMEEESFKRWFGSLIKDIAIFGETPQYGTERLVALQKALYALGRSARPGTDLGAVQGLSSQRDPTKRTVGFVVPVTADRRTGVQVARARHHEPREVVGVASDTAGGELTLEALDWANEPLTADIARLSEYPRWRDH